MSHYHIETDMLTLFTEILCLSLAILTGILAFRQMNSFFKTLFLQVVIWSLFYAGSHAITLYQQSMNQPIDNHWLMNIHLIIETGLLLTAAWFVLPKAFRTFLCAGAFLSFLTAIGIQGCMYGFDGYLNYADATACIAITVIFYMVLYTFGQQTRVRLLRSPEKWACLGILMYFACSVPYVCMIDYLQTESPAVNTFLYYLISGVLANIRYLLLALAFWMLYRQTNRKILNI
ncbi:hypothetical protein [Fluviicola sp.]|uniref:hypothetical protein n=1 Tax=Fluviicola sp. TaxID=1917219 RepID=UPI002623B3F5|nr:hypothetical protein [Fluviicola sp.]